ncbi:MAG: hypothetical protein QF752_03135, partial [Planctomycetota bacterium]|nr:hypothetical protein [Planctomycetota bacterium]
MRAISMLGMVLILMGSMLGSPVAAEESEVEAVEIRQARFTALTLESFGNTSLAKKLRVLLDKKDVGSIRQWLKKHQDAVRAANLAFFDASSASDRVKIKKQEDAIRDELVKRVEKIERIEKKRQADGRKRERDDKGRWRDDKGWGAQEREEDDRRRGRGWRENSDDED